MTLARWAVIPVVVLVLSAAVVGAVVPRVSAQHAPSAETEPSSSYRSATDSVNVIVVFESLDARTASVIEQAGGTVTGGRSVSVVPVLFARIPAGAMDSLANHPAVSLVERNREVENTAQTTPWGINRIDARAAAGNIASSNQAKVDVAIIDTGIDHDHEDLAPNVVWGVNTVGARTTTGVAAADDDNGHGTVVAGVVAAKDNDRGVVGVAPYVELYAIKSLNGSGTGTTTDVIEGLDRAVTGPDGERGTEDDADVISMSFGSPHRSEALERAVENLGDLTVLVAAAGNSGDDGVSYPAAHPEVIAVGATDDRDRTPSWSSKGPAVELAAPGVVIESTAPDDEYSSGSGTSVAAPHVVGAAALIIAKDLGDGTRDRSNAWIRSRLQATALDIEADGVDNKSGHGLVRVAKAVGVTANTAPSVQLQRPADGRTVAGTVIIGVTATDREDSGSELSVAVSIDGGPWRQASYDADRDEYRYAWDTRAAAEDTSHTIRARVTDTGGKRDTVTHEVTVDNVDNPPNLTVIAPANGTTVTGLTDVRVAAIDDRTAVGALNVSFRVDNGTWQTLDYNSTDGTFATTWDAAGVSAGNHTLQVRVDDGTDIRVAHRSIRVASPESPVINLSAIADTAIAGSATTVRFTVANAGDTGRAVGLRLTQVPASWAVINQTSDGGQWASNQRAWFWIEQVGPNATVSAAVTLCVANGTAPGNYSVGGVASDAEDHRATATATVPVRAGSDPVAVIAGDDGIVEFEDVLEAITAFNRGAPIPDREGRTLSFRDVLRLIDHFNSGERVSAGQC